MYLFSIFLLFYSVNCICIIHVVFCECQNTYIFNLSIFCISGNPDKKPYFGRYIGWNNALHHSRCKAGLYIHNICVFSIQDFPSIIERKEIIANKFDIEYDPIAYRCMEEWILTNSLNRTGIKYSRLYKKIPAFANI